jgi:hypothetical protein
VTKEKRSLEYGNIHNNIDRLSYARSTIRHRIHLCRESSNHRISGQTLSEESTVTLLSFLADRLARLPGTVRYVASVVVHDCDDSLLEDLVDSDHLLTATFHIPGTHLVRDSSTLFLCDWR